MDVNTRTVSPECRPRPLEELAEQLYKVLYRVYSILGRQDARCVPAGDLTLAQLSILIALREHGPMRISTLAAHERVRAPTTTVAIRRLEKLGFVARSRDPADLRGVLVAITDSGNAMCNNSLTARTAQLAAMLNALSHGDQIVLERAMPYLKRLVIEGAASRAQPSALDPE
jgi:DNA-binding MarR family transcriptional regulator